MGADVSHQLRASLQNGLLVIATFVVVAALPACPAPQVLTGCRSDLDCNASQTCDQLTSQCLCIDDNACDASEFCNIKGSCQLKLECLNNTDCRDADNPNAICNSTTGACLNLSAAVQCVLDSQCPYGSFCQNSQCQTGCQDNGDCNLGDPCIDGQCDPTPGACNGNAFCEFGQICGSDHRCRDHAQKDQLCSQCGPNDPFACAQDCLIDSSVEPTPCNTDADCERGECLAQGGGGGTLCFDDTDCGPGESCVEGGGLFGECQGGGASSKICQGFFCGASDCDDVTNPCPRGYSCFVLQQVSGIQCDLDNPNSCTGGRSCVGGGENGNVGFCSCVNDGDCPGATCVNPGPNGSCVIGTTCGPSDGLLCEDIR